MTLRYRLGLKWKIFAVLAILGICGQLADLWHSRILIAQAITSTEGTVRAILQHYLAYQQAIGQGAAAAAEGWATSPRLREVLASGDFSTDRPLMEAALRALEQSLHPELLVFVNRNGNLLASTGSPIQEADAARMRVFADLRQGQVIRNQLLEHQGVAYLVNGHPIEVGGQVVGGLVIGMRLERLMRDYKAQDDAAAQRRVDLALLHNGRVTASTLDGDEVNQISEATRTERREIIREGGSHVPVVVLSGERHEFHVHYVNGYDGGVTGTLGQLYVLRSRADKERRIRDLTEGSLRVLLLSILAALLASALLTSFVMTPIRAFVQATRAITRGGGDLTRRLPITSSDELGQLAQNLNNLFDNLLRLASEVAAASRQVGGSSEEISAASRRMLAGAKDQAVRIESSTAAVTELSASIQQVADNAMQATRLARESGARVQAAISGMNRIKQTVIEAAERIHELGESGKRIGNIVEVIRQISEQTSLLALNASIEAAHAGDQGRGFAVVADEVSSLARRVGQSARDIEELIATIREQTSEAVRSMQHGTREVESGTQVVTETLQSLQEIVGMVQKTASAVQEQAVVSDEIARNMDAVRKVTHEVLTSSEEVVREGDKLQGLARQLDASVAGLGGAIQEEPGHAAGCRSTSRS
ncbi:MAG: HAMP domain-containing methyl-accepting chemotaxis protein [Myxococcales bacterium]|nr:methyl-accepting chemotaxis protein [Myxococcota bacterium]MDW8282709.1 HAMP domain-containing methyl-accepting chemotaxis protein [Myxococcales bacterium]